MAREFEMDLVSGQELSSFEELSKSVQEWEKKNFVTLYTRSSRSVEAAKKRTPNRTYLGDLKFSELYYACMCSWRPRVQVKGNPEQTMSKVKHSIVHALAGAWIYIYGCIYWSFPPLL